MVLRTMKTSKWHNHRFEHTKRENESRPLLVLSFHQPTTVDEKAEKTISGRKSSFSILLKSII